MKRRIAIVCAMAMTASLMACGGPSGDAVVKEEQKAEDAISSTEQMKETENTDSADNAEAEDTQKEEAKSTEEQAESTEETETTESTEEAGETEKAETSDKAQKKEEQAAKTDKADKTSKPSKKADKADKPSKKPGKTEKPSKKPDKTEKTDKTNKEDKTDVGNTLLASFKEKAGSGNVESIANALVSNKIIPFAGEAVMVEEGLLMGFGNAEITGFKEGAMFGPVIGSIPFVGYVFELKDDTDVNQFISNLKSNANLRWNVCTEADEMVAGHVGKKVFFVMCEKSFEDE